MRIATACLLSLALLLPACGGSDPAALTHSGNTALGSGDFDAALADFQSALDAIGSDTSHPEYVRAKLGAIEAWTKLDPAKARDEFLKLADAMPDRVNDRDFNRIGGRLGDAGNINEATELAQAGKERYPDSAHLDTLIKRLGDQAQAGGDSEALEALRGLGYVGD